MSDAPRVRSMNPETRPVLAPAGNKVRPASGAKKPSLSPKPREGEEMKRRDHPGRVPRRQEWLLLQSNLSLNVSCSSDASVDSFCSRASTGRIGRNGAAGVGRRRVVTDKVVAEVVARVVSLAPSLPQVGSTDGKRRCGWVTANTGAISSSP